MIRIFDSAETNFSRNGLADISNVLTRANSNNLLNDLYSAQFDAVYDKWGKWKHIKEGNIIFADGQPFRIHKTQKMLRGFTVFCRHAFWDLLGNEVLDTRPTDKNAMSAGQDIMNGTTDPHPFTFFSDITDTNTQYYIKRNPVDCLIGQDSLRTRWGGDLRLNVWEIGIVGHLGQDNGVRIEYRKNMKDVDVTEDRDGLITKMRPKGKDGLELPEVYVNSPYIGNYHMPYIGEVEFTNIGVDETTTLAEAIVQLRAAANQYFLDSKCDIPKTNIKVDMILLENTVEYKSFQNLVRVNLGDTVTCRHLDLGIDHKARVIRIEKDLLTGKAAVIEIGEFKRNINSAFTKITNTIKDISALITNNKTSLQEAIDHATDLLTSSLGGHVIKRAGELLIMDTEDPATAVKLWRWNLNGLGYSSTGINGPYGIAMLMDGSINASMITTGELDAAVIKTGTIKADALSVEANQAIFNMFDIGGRNLLLDSATERIGANEYLPVPIFDVLIANIGKELTFSFDLKASSAGPIDVYALGSFNIGYRAVEATTSYQRFSFTITPEILETPQTWSDWSFYGTYGTGRIPTVRNLQIEPGNKATAYRPAPEEMYSGITRIDRDGINVGVSTSEVNTQVAYDGLTVKDGDKILASFGQTGALVPTLQATSVIAANVFNSISGNKLLGVGSGQAYPTITAALESVFGSNRKILTGGLFVEVFVYGSISDNVEIHGLMGDGAVIIRLMDSASINGSVNVTGNQIPIIFAQGGTGRGRVKRTNETVDRALNVKNSFYVEFQNVDVDNNGGNIGLGVANGGRVFMFQCDIANTAQGVWVEYGGQYHGWNNRGTASDVGVYAYRGALACVVGTTIFGTSGNHVYAPDGLAVTNNVTPTTTAFAAPAVTPTVFTGLFVPASMYTVNHDTTSVDSYYGATAAQGRYSGMSYWKDGVMTFGADIYNYWQGGYNVTVEMRVRRKNSSHGTSAGVVPTAYNFSPSEAFNAIGQGVWSEWTTVPSSVFGASGATLKFYNGNLNSGYAILDAAEVRVTVTKDV